MDSGMVVVAGVGLALVVALLVAMSRVRPIPADVVKGLANAQCHASWLDPGTVNRLYDALVRLEGVAERLALLTQAVETQAPPTPERAARERARLAAVRRIARAARKVAR